MSVRRFASALILILKRRHQNHSRLDQRAATSTASRVLSRLVSAALADLVLVRREPEEILDCPNRSLIFAEKAEAGSQNAAMISQASGLPVASVIFALFAIGHVVRSGQTSAGNGRNSPSTDVGKRGRAYHRCYIEYLDVVTLLRSGLSCRGRARTTRSSSNCLIGSLMKLAT
jgi:hypothetical protein